MRVPVILLNYNSSADCRDCVADLKRQEGVELDIVIVDNCSPREGEQDTIRQLCTDEGCTFIQAKENRGYNAGNNIGLRYADEKDCKYALIANPDMHFPQTDYVAQLVKVMEEWRWLLHIIGVISTEKLHGMSSWHFLGEFSQKLFSGCRDFLSMAPLNIGLAYSKYHANEYKVKLSCILSNAADIHQR